MNIGIIFAMQIEMDAFLSVYDSYENKEHPLLNTHIIHTDQHTIICALSGVGKVNAAMVTTLLIQNHPLDYLFNIGVAGGIHIPIETIVLAENTLYSDVNVNAFGYPLGQLPGQSLTQEIDRVLLEKTKTILTTHNFKHHLGWIASGDQFVISLEALKPVLDLYPKVCAVDMESASIMHVANRLNVPALIMRSISDQVGAKAQSVDFNQFVKTASEKVALVLKETIASL